MLAKFIQGQIAGIDMFMQDDARIGTQLPMDLTGSGINAVNSGGSVLEKAIGKAAG
jgi:hypothetical protein